MPKFTWRTQGISTSRMSTAQIHDRRSRDRSIGIHPAEKKRRVEHCSALQMQISQVRKSNGRWSDGKRIFSGEELDKIIQNALNKLINTRGDDLRTNFGIYVGNLVRAPGHLGQQSDEDVPSWLTRLLTNHVGSDMGSRHRSEESLRILRRHYPETWAKLPFDCRYSQTEAEFVTRSRNNHEWLVSADIPVGKNIKIPAGSYAKPQSNGSFKVFIFDPEAGINGEMNVEDLHVRKMTSGEISARRRIIDAERREMERLIHLEDEDLCP